MKIENDYLKIFGDFEISNNEQWPNYIRPVGAGFCNQLREAINDKVSRTPFLRRDDNLIVNGEVLKWYGRHVCTEEGKFIAYLPEESDYFASEDLFSCDYLGKYAMTKYRDVIVSFRKDTDDTIPSDERLTPKALLDPVEKVIRYPYYIDSAPLTCRDCGNGAISLLLYSIKPKKKPYIIIKNDKNGFIEGLLLWYNKEYSKALYIELSINTKFGKLSNGKYLLGIDFVSYHRENDGNWEMSELFPDWISRKEKYPLNEGCRGKLSNFFTNDLPLIKSSIADLREDSNRVSKFTTWLVDKISQSSWDYIETYKEFNKFLENLFEIGTDVSFNKSIQLLFSWKATGFSKPVYKTDFSNYVPVGGDLKEEEDISFLRYMPYDWANKDGKFSFTSSVPVQISEICKRHEGLSEKLFLEGFVQKDADYWVEVLGKPTLINFKKVMDDMGLGSKKLTIKDLEDGKFYVTEDITPEGIDRGKLFVVNRYLVKDGNPGKGSLSYIEGVCRYNNEGAYFYTLPKDLFDKVISVIKTEDVERNKYLLKKELYDKKDYVTFLKEIVWGTDDESEIEDYNTYLEEVGSDDDCDIHGADFYSWKLFLELFPKSLHEFFVDKNSSEEVKAQIKKLIPYESKYDPEFDFRFVDPSEIPSKVTLSSPEDWMKIQKPDGVSITVEFVLH